MIAVISFELLLSFQISPQVFSVFILVIIHTRKRRVTMQQKKWFSAGEPTTRQGKMDAQQATPFAGEMTLDP